MNEINHLKSKYGNSIDEILSYCAEKEEQLIKLQDYDAYLDLLRKNLRLAEEKVRNASDKLTALRKEASEKLTKAIKAGLWDLNFLDVQFAMVFTKLEHFTANGTDEVEFMISMNPGEPVRPLGDVASGGELSRIMLAIKTVMAENNTIL